MDGNGKAAKLAMEGMMGCSGIMYFIFVRPSYKNYGKGKAL